MQTGLENTCRKIDREPALVVNTDLELKLSAQIKMKKISRDAKNMKLY